MLKSIIMKCLNSIENPNHGEKKPTIQSSMNGRYYIYCRDCGLETKRFRSLPRAIKQWNELFKAVYFMEDDHGK